MVVEEKDEFKEFVVSDEKDFTKVGEIKEGKEGIEKKIVEDLSECFLFIFLKKLVLKDVLSFYEIVILFYNVLLFIDFR